jgi:hypothetical protein
MVIFYVLNSAVRISDMDSVIHSLISLPVYSVIVYYVTIASCFRSGLTVNSFTNRVVQFTKCFFAI